MILPKIGRGSTLNLGLWPRFANNLQPSTFNPQPWPLATLREQPSTHPTSDAKSEQPSTITYFRPVSQ
ncbi:hypothetical protein [Moorena bouillonii]|uniref:hypothetical protein n=1 Tax=Moorena bouillonii TaxID=207920 RepID=UPI00117CE23F|nr:hypothetical protein [Moorena bouillonii]